MNKINKLSHLSSKSDKLHPPRDWGSWSREFCLPEILATLAGCCQRHHPHTVATPCHHPGASLPKAATPHSKVKPELRLVCLGTSSATLGLNSHSMTSPAAEASPVGPDPKTCRPLSMLTGHVKVAAWGLGMTHRGAEAGAVHGNHRSDRRTSGAAEVKTGSAWDLLFAIPGDVAGRLAVRSRPVPDTPSVG